MKKKFLIPMLALSLSALALTACGEGKKEEGKKAESKEDGVNQFTAFFSVQGAEINDDNEIQEIIAKKTGAKVKETWLTGQTAEEAIGTMIAGGDYPDFIDGGSNSVQLYQAGALVPLDDYLDKYPNIKNFLTEEDWDKLRQDDGHIYWIPQFSNIRNAESGTVHNDEAFWIQARVLEWAGYPQIKTMDEYFDIIEGYLKEHPTMEDGTPNVGYTILAEGW
ncbi:MAG TPA: extracellular solute-binding protein, partial [Lachnospiraceae bacterium]